jgi:5-(carboxyamino)imidazole ribonucleotide synthase
VTHALHSSAVVGVVGGGQLARMLAQAASPLGIDLRVLAGARDEGASPVAPTVRGDIDDPAVLVSFARECDVLTFDHELVPLPTVRAVEAEGVTVRPGADTLARSDKSRLRADLADRFPFPPHAIARSAEDVDAFAASHGWPVVVKAASGGYDGRGVHVADGPERARMLMDALDPGVPAVTEPVLDLDAELAVVVARRPGGEHAVYPVVRTVQVEGICHEVRYPADVGSDVEAEAASLALAVADATEAVGVLAVEFFVSGGAVLLNEIAPRPHNSGHWTIDGAATSQFEQHLRAVLDWPMGSTDPVAPAAVMVNLIPGDPPADPRDAVAAALEAGDVRVHLYDKTPRPGRKVGHLTSVGDDPAGVRSRVFAAAAAMGSITAGGVQ